MAITMTEFALTEQLVQHRALERAIQLARDFSTLRSPLIVYRPPDVERYLVTFKSCTADYRPEWVVWPTEEL